MRIGIMGGTFNPVHNAHLVIAENARDEYKLDKVIFITGGNPPHKHSNVTARHRFNMTHIAISTNSFFEDDCFEIERCEKSYTVHTLEYLKNKYPCDELFFIIGEDSLRDFKKWYMPRQILNMCTLLVFARVSHDSLNETIKTVTDELGGNIKAIHSPIMEISSTDIRSRIRNGQTIKYLVPDSVIEYIYKYRLYEG